MEGKVLLLALSAVFSSAALAAGGAGANKDAAPGDLREAPAGAEAGGQAPAAIPPGRQVGGQLENGAGTEPGAEPPTDIPPGRQMGGQLEDGVGQLGFQQLDENGDGQISREEAQAVPALAENFDQYDEGGTGQLDRAEFAAFQEAQTGASEGGAGAPAQ